MEFPAHILVGFSLGFRHRHRLQNLLHNSSTNFCILELDPTSLRSSGISTLALDFDGVLASHGTLAPRPEVIEWMKRCQTIFGGNQIFILSNKPTEERRKWFGSNFPDMRFISGVRKKPYPDGLNKTGELAGVPLSSIIMVDDRLLTGCLAALVAGARPCYIRKPYISFKHRPVAEAFFMLLRICEKLFVKICSRI